MLGQKTLTSPPAGPSDSPQPVDPLLSISFPAFKHERTEGSGDEFERNTTNSEVAAGSEKKEQTLGELCKELIRLCEDPANCSIDLDSTAQSLGAEPKDLQHLINVLKSLEVVSRRTRTVYDWKGLGRMCKFVSKLEVSAVLRQHFACQTENRPSKKFKFKSRKQRSACEDPRESVLLNLTQDFMQTTCQRKESSWGKLALRLAVFFVQSYKALSSSEIVLALTRKLSCKPLKAQSQMRKIAEVVDIFKGLGLVSEVAGRDGIARLKWCGQKGIAIRNIKADTKRITPLGKTSPPTARQFRPRVILQTFKGKETDSKDLAGKRGSAESAPGSLIVTLGLGAFKRLSPVSDGC